MNTSLKQRQHAFVQLGQLLSSLANDASWPGFQCGLTEEEWTAAQGLIDTVKQYNGWFTGENVRCAMDAWGKQLTPERLEQWLAPYAMVDQPTSPSTVAVICAGNIPMVGFHDVLCVLISGHRALIKLSSDDHILIPFVLKCLETLEPAFKGSFTYAQGKLTDFQAVIATGSDNTARHFDYYFSKYPHIIRKNRNSIAVLSGKESAEELSALGHDIFDYFGLGCRNVTRIFVPSDYDLDTFLKGIFSFQNIIHHNKYANNYDYNKAVWLLNKENLLDNGFILLKEENEKLACPTAGLYYSRYSDLQEVDALIEQRKDQLQCIISARHLPFGTSQQPGLADYADGVDTLKFLNALNA